MSNSFLMTQGANLRTALAAVYQGGGTPLGWATAKRYLWEIGDVVAEMHGRAAALEIFHRAIDDLMDPDRIAVLGRLSESKAARVE